MAQLVVWGGEPLLRQDLPELLLAARRSRLFVTLISNGWFLQERWPALRGAVDALILSLDEVGDAHDRLRGLPGLFARLEAFVEMLRADALRPTLLLNTVLSGQNPGALRRVAAVARRWGAGLYFCPMETGELSAGEAGDRLAGLALRPDELRAAARLALDLKDAGYPVFDSRPYLRLLAADPGSRPIPAAPHGHGSPSAPKGPSATVFTPTGRSRTSPTCSPRAAHWRPCSARPAGGGWERRPHPAPSATTPM